MAKWQVGTRMTLGLLLGSEPVKECSEALQIEQAPARKMRQAVFMMKY